MVNHGDPPSIGTLAANLRVTHTTRQTAGLRSRRERRGRRGRTRREAAGSTKVRLRRCNGVSRAVFATLSPQLLAVHKKNGIPQWGMPYQAKHFQPGWMVAYAPTQPCVPLSAAGSTHSGAVGWPGPPWPCQLAAESARGSGWPSQSRSPHPQYGHGLW